MTDSLYSGVADEAPWNRRVSPIGAPQRHYVLNPMLITEAGVCADGVVVIVGSRGTYVYASDADGEIADYTEVASAPAGTGDGETLAMLGYRVVTPFPQTFTA